MTEASWPSPARAWWTVIVLTFAYVISFVDRTILSLLIEPIKADLALSDTQIALVQGVAFSLFYAAMGLPLGWLADRMSRRLLVGIGAGFWCIATAACGLASSFPQLFVARIGVGVGEAALSPSAMSMISDSFPKERRALPIGIYAGAAALGAGLALILGGSVIRLVSGTSQLSLPLVGDVAAWQVAFIAVGVAGLVLLPLMASVTEPLRRNDFGTQGPVQRIDRFIRQHASFMVRHYVAVSTYSILIYAVLSWVPAHLIRVFGWTPAEVGLRYGLLLLVFGGCGTIVGAWFATWLGRRGVQHPAIVVTAGGMAAAGLLLSQAGWADTPWAALAWYAPGVLCLTLPGGTAIQVIQEAVPNQLRGQASAIYYLTISVVGQSLGPLSVALLTDYVFGDPLKIGSAIAVVSLVIAPVTALLSISSRTHFGRMIASPAAQPSPGASGS